MQSLIAISENNSIHKKSDGQKGHAALYVIVCLPMVLALTVLAIDVSRFQGLKESGQARVDEIATDAARLLPNTTSALAFVADAFSQESELFLSQAPNITNERVEITARGSVDSLFDFLFELSGNAGQVFSFEESSVAVVVPQDVMIIMSDDNSLRPKANNAWGSESSWPASKYFDFVNAPEITGAGASSNPVYWDKWWESYDDTLYRRWATQSCYNPVFSALKSSVVSFIDRIQASPLNQVGLVFTPGDDPSLGFSKAQPLAVSPSVASWSSYWESRSYISDEACVLFGDESESDDSRYTIFSMPGFMEDVSQNQTCGSLIANQTWGSLFYPFGNLNSCYLTDSLSLREAVYYHAARANPHSLDAGNIVEALKESVSSFSEIDSTQMQLARGNLYSSSGRRIVAFLDAFPAITSERLSEILQVSSSQGSQIQIDIILFSHIGMTSAQVNDLRAVAEDLEQGTLANIRVIYADGAEDLVERVIPEVLRRNFEVVLFS